MLTYFEAVRPSLPALAAQRTQSLQTPQSVVFAIFAVHAEGLYIRGLRYSGAPLFSVVLTDTHFVAAMLATLCMMELPCPSHPTPSPGTEPLRPSGFLQSIGCHLSVCSLCRVPRLLTVLDMRLACKICKAWELLSDAPTAEASSSQLVWAGVRQVNTSAVFAWRFGRLCSHAYMDQIDAETWGDCQVKTAASHVLTVQGVRVSITAFSFF